MQYELTNHSNIHLYLIDLITLIILSEVRVIKSTTLRWAGHVARMEEDRSVFKILTDKPTGKRHLGMIRLRIGIIRTSGLELVNYIR